MSSPRILFLLLPLGLSACGADSPALPGGADVVQASEPSADAKQALARGKELYQAGQQVEALTDLRRAVELAPGWAEAQLQLGKLLVSLSFVRFGTATREHALLDEAHVALGRAVALRPEHADSHYWKAHAQFVDRRFEEAAVGFQRVLQLDPKHRLATKELGLCYEELGQPEKVRDTFLQAQELLRFDDEARFHLGIALEALEDLTGAKEEYLAALAVNPAYPGPRVNLIQLCHRLGQSEEAQHHVAELERMAPLRQRLTAVLAQAQTAPRDPAALLAVAEVYREIGMPVAARSWASRALELDPAHTGAKALLDALAVPAKEN